MRVRAGHAAECWARTSATETLEAATSVRRLSVELIVLVQTARPRASPMRREVRPLVAWAPRSALGLVLASLPGGSATSLDWDRADHSSARAHAKTVDPADCHSRARSLGVRAPRAQPFVRSSCPVRMRDLVPFR